MIEEIIEEIQALLRRTYCRLLYLKYGKASNCSKCYYYEVGYRRKSFSCHITGHQIYQYAGICINYRPYQKE